jgi:hypothetical protein
MSKVDSLARLPRPKPHLPRRKPLDRALRLCWLYDIQTVYGLIKAFGGFDETAAEYGIATEEVERWAVSGFIGTGWHLRMFAHACALGLTVNPSVFGFWDDDAGHAYALTCLMRDARLHREGGAHA